jgi:hypothetical protein
MSSTLLLLTLLSQFQLSSVPGLSVYVEVEKINQTNNKAPIINLSYKLGEVSEAHQ